MIQYELHWNAWTKIKYNKADAAERELGPTTTHYRKKKKKSIIPP
jgi:hypothetical protein